MGENSAGEAAVWNGTFLPASAHVSFSVTEEGAATQKAALRCPLLKHPNECLMAILPLLNL